MYLYLRHKVGWTTIYLRAAGDRTHIILPELSVKLNTHLYLRHKVGWTTLYLREAGGRTDTPLEPGRGG